MHRDDSVYLGHILEAIEIIETYIGDLTEADFSKQGLIQDGVIRRLEIIGEAIKNISHETKAKSPNARWRDFAGMRDVLIHRYFGVDLPAVWDTITIDLPELKQEVISLLNS